jgi:hypothetical protein
MVNFRERVSLSVVLLVELNRRFCDSEDSLIVKVVSEGVTDEDPLWSMHRVGI